ncbi:hypothetical protein CAOG_06779 [Capsaspora owczarzaki ATCC 30864]|uniref:Small nuclear ribonucleoprotein G n=1 Tax=Capsaspora owczarzaki (strain ATCC 30864) TaxID=595528 RepID=A0A0D2WVV2_CAPO3|nr:hypothetical protein CAOG_06779 [Capsaspora owczarzaki ATCC 30864]KJE96453.1 hypothetical protein CAOG_006779 [Capsaspora owczarzaki ATCC 30864]|eukprot:XP_004344400.1 hypothetical protein CAOG_06779 [Capsaspora owczarzaki ATCC 30864]
MSKPANPELKKFLDRRVILKLNGNRKVSGILRGFDPFMNVVLDETFEEVSESERHEIGMVAIRGNSINMVETVDRSG